VVAWLFSLVFHFVAYAMRSAPSVMLPELRTAFGLTPVGLSSLIGLYYYTYAVCRSKRIHESPWAAGMVN